MDASVNIKQNGTGTDKNKNGHHPLSRLVRSVYLPFEVRLISVRLPFVFKKRPFNGTETGIFFDAYCTCMNTTLLCQPDNNPRQHAPVLPLPKATMVYGKTS